MVIPSVNGMPDLAECLEGLERHAPGAEVIVAERTGEQTRRAVSERWPHVRLLRFDEPATVPELRAAGIAEATGRYVAVIEDHTVPRDGWAQRLLAAHRDGRPVVGGPLRNRATRRIRDWAAFFCEYSEHMEPMDTGPAPSLTGVNVSYDRKAIEVMEDLLGEGRWEAWLHPHLQESGVELYADGAATLDHVKRFGFGHFTSQRYHQSRSHAGMRNPELGWKRVIYVIGFPALVPMLYARIAGNVVRKQRHRGQFVLATPLILFYLAVGAAGEAVGYTLGGGRSIHKVQ